MQSKSEKSKTSEMEATMANDESDQDIVENLEFLLSMEILESEKDWKEIADTDESDIKN